MWSIGVRINKRSAPQLQEIFMIGGFVPLGIVIHELWSSTSQGHTCSTFCNVAWGPASWKLLFDISMLANVTCHPFGLGNLPFWSKFGAINWVEVDPPLHLLWYIRLASEHSVCAYLTLRFTGASTFALTLCALGDRLVCISGTFAWYRRNHIGERRIVRSITSARRDHSK